MSNFLGRFLGFCLIVPSLKRGEVSVIALRDIEEEMSVAGKNLVIFAAIDLHSRHANGTR